MGETTRSIQRTFSGRETLEGAGVRLRRVFGNSQIPLLDPFLLLDNFGSTNPADYVAGFPWHPHRGIETVTYMLEGRVEHGDTLGNEGVIDGGDVQWMSAGSGLLHQEMPKRKEGLLAGFQLWVNLPSKLKMSPPAYRGIVSTEIPTVHPSDGSLVKVVAGEFEGVEGPVQGIPVDPTYLDVTLPPHTDFRRSTPSGYTAFAHVMEGSGTFAPGESPSVPPGSAVLYSPGDQVEIRSGTPGCGSSG